MFVHPHIDAHWLKIGGIAAATLVVAATTTTIIIVRRRPTASQREERRRKRLASLGRIVDGSLVDVAPAESQPQTIIYRYRIAGVTYECSQDVSTLTSLVQNLRLDYPVQVRYNRTNPADSIVVSETWNGLWTNLWTHGERTRTRR
jgi:hypothetical protein